MRKSWVPENNYYSNIFEFLSTPQRLNEAENLDIDFPKSILEQLSKWSILNDVSFQYYVPREDMLPLETVRFFYVDHNWLLSMLDGACSIGRTTNGNYTHDREIIEQVYSKALAQNINVRKRLQQKPEFLTSTEDAFPICTGFLLRSELVKGWRGLEFKAYDNCEDTTPDHELKAIRIETLSDNVLLCIYRGLIKRVEIAQPPEGFHYGFAVENESKHKEAVGYEKSLRYLSSGEIIYKTQGINDAVTAPVAVKNHRVIDWKQSAHNIVQVLSQVSMTEEPTTIKEDAALIALQMIQNAYTGIIKNSQQDNP